MFRTAVLRAARLPRATGVSSSAVAALRPAVLRAAGLSRTPVLGRVVPAVSALARFARTYSTIDATAAEEAPEQAAQAAADAPETTPGLVTQFTDLERIGVHANLIRSLTQRLGYDTMTAVQSATISPALAGKDVVAQAKTGTGKTLAFLIPTIQRMIDANPDLAFPRRSNASSRDILAIVMSPTRELAEQIGEEARKLCRGTGVIVQTAVGGTQKHMMIMRARREGCHLLVATPGRLNDILRSPETGIAAPNLSALVLDEADRMLDVGFADELRQIVRQLPDRARTPRQTLLFSATVPKNVVSLARTYIDSKNFEFVQTVKADDTLTHEKVPQHIVSVRGYENIYPTILELVQREVQAAREAAAGDKMPFKAMVFLPTTNFVELTAVAFRSLARENRNLPHIHHIHSKLTQRARTVAAENFRNAKSAILFSSDVTARGMDFPNVSHVIQVGVPPDRDQYIHRLGRTGRADKGGEGWVIIAKDEVPVARRILTDLPIQRADSLECADYDLAETDDANRPQAVKDVTAVMKRMPDGLLRDAYQSFFGGASAGRSLQTTLDNVNNWAIKGWGWEKPPSINPYDAARRGLMKLHGLNLGPDNRPTGRSDSGQNADGMDEFEAAFSQGSRDSRSAQGRKSYGSGYSSERGSYSSDRGSYGLDRGSYGSNKGRYGSDRGGRSSGSSQRFGASRSSKPRIDRSGYERAPKANF